MSKDRWVVVNKETGITVGPFPDKVSAEAEKERRDARAQALLGHEPDPAPDALSVAPADEFRLVPLTREDFEWLERLDAQAQLGYLTGLSFDARRIIRELIGRYEAAPQMGQLELEQDRSDASGPEHAD